MGYNPHKYKHLFSKGIFNYPNKPLTTWFESHKLFALNMQPLKSNNKKLAEGLIMKRGHIRQEKGFSNYMIFEIDPKKRDINLEFLLDGVAYPIDVYRKIQDPLYLTNAGYFYLTDDEKRDPVPPPSVRIGNFVFSNGKLINLPILDRSAILIYKDGHIDLVFLRSRGKMIINGKEYEWVGSKTSYKKEGKLVVYNSSNIKINIVNDPIMGPSRVATKVFIEPSKDNKLAVCKMIRGKAWILKLTKEKQVINDKDMILEVGKNFSIKEGDDIRIESVDNLNLDKVKSAVSVGPMVFKDKKRTILQVVKEKFGHDMANPNDPHEKGKRLARGCLLKLKGGKLVSILIDGIPQAGDVYPGVTLEEMNEFVVQKYPDFLSAICTDPSSTMKGIYKTNGKVEIFGNLHYLAHKRDKEGKIDFWPNGIKGRKVNSLLLVK